jgi:hypothetical protein
MEDWALSVNRSVQTQTGYERTYKPVLLSLGRCHGVGQEQGTAVVVHYFCYELGRLPTSTSTWIQVIQSYRISQPQSDEAHDYSLHVSVGSISVSS